MNKVENNIIIGIDTSCYTTSIAAISLEKNIILNEKNRFRPVPAGPWKIHGSNENLAGG